MANATSRIMVTKEVVAAVGVSYKTINKWENQGGFPERLGCAGKGASYAWSRTEVMDWIRRCELAGVGLAEEAAALAALPVITLLHHFSTDTLDIAYWSDKELTITKRTCTA
jgi:predicted DNA-binding transcriptional regulator AlpA